jgi:hypothetical protein
MGRALDHVSNPKDRFLVNSGLRSVKWVLRVTGKSKKHKVSNVRHSLTGTFW